MSVNYTRINWEDSPSTQTPLNSENLNAMDSAIDDLAGAVNELDGVTEDVEDLQTEIGALKNDLTQKADKTDALSAYVVETATGSIASFTDGADDVPVKDLTVAIEPVQSGSGDPSPENVRPISGWTGAVVSANGINQWDEDWTVGRWAEQHGVLNPSFASYVASKNKIPVKPNTTYYFRVDFSGATAREVVYFDADKNWISDGNSVYADAPFTTPAGCYYIAFNLGGGYGATYNHNVSINYPSTDHDYHAYNGSSVSVDWTTEAGTVYGGTLDVTTGVLTVDRVMVDLGDKNWSLFGNTGSRQAWVAYFSDIKPPVNGSTPYDAISSEFKGVSYNASWLPGVFAPTAPSSATGVAFCVESGKYADASEFKEAVTGVQFCYTVAEPQIYQLTPQEVSTILGQNNIFADTGDSTVQYRADTKLYIDKVLNA